MVPRLATGPGPGTGVLRRDAPLDRKTLAPRSVPAGRL
jgi:hypothetical protein